MSSRLTVLALQQALVGVGHDITCDGDLGPQTTAALLAEMMGGANRTPLSAAAISDAAKRLLLDPAQIGAVCDVESCGGGFDPETRMPVIRFEPHVFRDRTDGRFDGTHPDISHAYGARSLYPQPSSQSLRWEIVLRAARLDPDAAFSATSWGLFQVMGFNWAAAGYPDLFSFLRGMAANESAQLMAFCQLLKSMGLLDELRRNDWAGFAAKYNGPGYDDAPGRRDDYDTKLAEAYKARGGK